MNLYPDKQALQSPYIQKTTQNLKHVIEDSGATAISGYEFHVGDDSNHICVYYNGQIVQNLTFSSTFFDAEAICIKSPSDMNTTLRNGDEVVLAVMDDRRSKRDGRSTIVELSFKMVENRFEFVQGSRRNLYLDIREKTESLEWDSKHNRYIFAAQACNKPKHCPADNYYERYDYNLDNIGHFFAYYPQTGQLKRLGTTGSEHPTDMHRDGQQLYVLTRDLGVLGYKKIPENPFESATYNSICTYSNPKSEGLIVYPDEVRIFLDYEIEKYDPVIIKRNVNPTTTPSSPEQEQDMSRYLTVQDLNKKGNDYVVLGNSSSVELNLKGYQLRDNGNSYTLNDSFTIKPGGTLKITLKDKSLGLKHKKDEKLRIYSPEGQLLFIDYTKQ